jgi:hypothetical protein
MLLQIDRTLTKDKTSTLADMTHAGMASWGGEGPRGTVCKDCKHWQHVGYYSRLGKHAGGLKDARCQKYKQFTGTAGAPVPPDAPSCKYIEQRDEPLPLQQPTNGAR